ncbi:MAG: hypothetical protein KGJ23_00280 [Euryarchaeota archaeon]|nr:hypothetical protein [Euryarchaeota archaeon]MDE1835032.1 hypothetical protein [Euryarchaeota archaeon]MDE1882122.1 hypothetical protein [Euryarchaeota archaeon]MDE2044871.1 hypothetical protein [Thermoplasmata archaeon]
MSAGRAPWDEEVLFHREASPSRFPCFLLAAGGLLVLLALVLPWYTFSALGPVRGLNGVDLMGHLPELAVLAAGAIGLVILAAALVRPRVWGTGRAHETLPKLAATLVALGVFALPLVAAFRFNTGARSLWGALFLDSAGVGFYLAMVGGTLALLGALALWLAAPSAPAEEGYSATSAA